MTNHCGTCACSVNGTYCTRQKDMSTAKYKQCDGYMVLAIQVEVHIEKTQREERLEAKSELEPGFSQFLKKGGFYSGRTGQCSVEVQK